MSASYDVAAIGNAIVDVIAPADEAFLVANGLAKGAMTLIDEPQAHDLYGRMAQSVEASGGSARPISARSPPTSWARCSSTTPAPSG